MYGGHFPPLGHAEMVQPPPIRFTDREGRVIDLRAFGERATAELDALRELYRDFDPKFRTLGVPPIGEERLDRWLEILTGDVCVLAWHGSRVVGQAALVPDPRRDAHEFTVFLHQSYHGAGIGTRLTEAALSLGREEGVTHVWLLVESENRAAVGLYRTVGFVVTSPTGTELEMALTM
jgi:GNAT superfamily N-acetyltransferase